MSILNKLTEGIVNRDLSREGAAILTKWEKTGLLEGLSDYDQNTMAVLLENQAKELLRESNSMAGGDVEGFAAVAFPIVRRVFGGLLAQKLVSVQPMSLPSGLIFFMDFVKQGPNQAATGSIYAAADQRAEMDVRNGATAGDEPSVYGGQITGRSILTSGVSLDTEDRAVGTPSPQLYDLVQGFSFARGAVNSVASDTLANGSFDVAAAMSLDGSMTDGEARAIQFDPDLMARSTGQVQIIRALVSTAASRAAGTATGLNSLAGAATKLNSPAGSFLRCVKPDVRHIDLQDQDGTTLLGHGSNLPTNGQIIRRLSRIIRVTAQNQNSACLDQTTAVTDSNFVGNEYLEIAVYSDDAAGTDALIAHGTVVDAALAIEFAMSDNIDESTDSGNSDTLGALVGASAWEMEGSVDLPEISIKVDSVAVTAVTRKLKASWTPELAQDLNAYHNLDAEVELTGILSEQIALEIDQEILSDLIAGAKASTLYWSRRPGLFVTRTTGADATSLAAPPDFTGSVSEWYETLVETINDVSADIHRKTLRGGANFLVCGPEVANILEFTSGFRASVTHDDDTGSVGAINAGSISKKWDL
jgi:hypothetical protein